MVVNITKCWYCTSLLLHVSLFKIISFYLRIKTESYMKNAVQERYKFQVLAEKADKRFFYIGAFIFSAVSVSTLILVVLLLSNTLDKYS